LHDETCGLKSSLYFQKLRRPSASNGGRSEERRDATGKEGGRTAMTEVHKTEARQGATGNKVRNVLGISLILAVIALGVIFFAFA
jgi:hypothetical protein